MDKIDALRSRVAQLNPAQREAFRQQLEERGISWESVAPAHVVAQAEPTRLPLSPSQYFLWVYQNLYPGSPAYLIAFQWHMQGTLDLEAVRQSFQHVIDRHEPLRTCFPTEDGRPWQKVLETTVFELGFTDLSDTPEDFETQARTIGNRPFELANAPLLRGHIFRRGENDFTLVVTLHHIIGDGWSRGVLMRELAQSYAAFARGGMPVLPGLDRRFGDFVRDQGRWLESSECDGQRDYWKSRLADLEPQELPSDRPRISADDMRCATVLQTLPAALSQDVSVLASRLGTSSFVLLLAAFKLLLHRHTGRHDLAVCIPVAGRKDPDAADLIGLFTNTLVLRTELRPTLTFRQWVACVQETFVDAFENQDFPFTRLLDILGVSREVVQNPLFQIAFQVQTQGYRQQNAEKIDLGVPDLHIQQEILPLPEAKLDLSWNIMERESGYALAIEYRTALFDADRIERLVQHFQTLLGSILLNPDAFLPDLAFMPDEERQALIDIGTSRPRNFEPMGLHEAISAAAAHYPYSVALEASGREWTYSELEADGEALARWLLAMPEPIRPGSRVAVALPRNGWSIIAFIAILKAGATYVPLDPRHPADRIAYVIEDADVELVLTEEPALFPGQRCIDPANLDRSIAGGVLPSVQSSTIAYMLYTSGSTGRPKGVPIDHGAMLNQFRSLARRPGIGHGDRMMVVTTPVFDISILEMLWPLTVGATVVLDSRDLLFMLEELAKGLVERNITHLQTTPAYWRMLVESGWEGKPGLKALCGGEALDAPLARKLVERTGELWNVYGPTEATIWVSALKVEQNHLKSGKVPIGGVLDNTQLHVLDAYMQPAPKGVPGELYIGGVCLSSGYWRRPSLAAEKFVPNPFADSTVHGASLYRTGDIAIRHGENQIEFVGRVDSQVKLRGYRIEVGEIESILQEEAGVEQAIVLLDEPNERLIAYILLQEQNRPADKEAFKRDIRRRIAARLPRYMVPTAFVPMEEFPLNPSGKVDRKRLPAPDMPIGEAVSTAPRNAAEQTLLDVWQDVLKRDDIGIEDNFFDLGGDSIIAMQIVARAQARGLVLTPTQIFDYQTVASQAILAKAADAAADGLSVWQEHHRYSNREPWILLMPWTASKAVTVAAASAVSTHHPVLRGRFKGVEVLAGEADDENLRALAHEAISTDASMNWKLWITGEGESRSLVLAVHPLLLDDRSVIWLAEDLREAAARLSSGAVASLQVSGTYEDWLAAFAERQEAIKGTPFEDERIDAEEGSATVTAVLNRASSDKVATVARHLETSIEMLATASLAEVLLEHVDQNLIGIDVLTSSRTETAWRRAIGNFQRLVPVAVEHGKDAPGPSRIPALATSFSKLLAGQGMAPSVTEKSSAAFVWSASAEDGTTRSLSLPAAEPLSGYPLVLHAHLSGDGLKLQWQHDPRRLRTSTVERLAARHLELLTVVEAGRDSSAARVDRLLAKLGRK